jgi:hypothetical protein
MRTVPAVSSPAIIDLRDLGRHLAGDDQTERLRSVAHKRLDEAIDDAIRGRLFGGVTIEVSYQNGILTAVRTAPGRVDK